MVTLARHGVECFTFAPSVAGQFFDDELTASAVIAFEEAARAGDRPPGRAIALPPRPRYAVRRAVTGAFGWANHRGAAPSDSRDDLPCAWASSTCDREVRCLQPNAESTAFRSALEVVRAVEPRIADAIAKELHDQRESLKLIASENYASPAVLLAMGNWLSDKYAEGTIGRRFYAGCQNVDTVEAVAAEHAKASCSARRTRTSSRTPASTPTWSRTGRSWPTGSRCRR